MNRQRLDDAVAASAGVTRSHARSLIIAGRVRMNGRTATKPGAAVPPAAKLEIERPRPYVSRGGEKLENALRAFALDVRGMRALDVGASTGGFTDCLLAHGAEHVVALDVGYGQLDFTLRANPHVTVLERYNFRLAPDDAFDAEFDVIVVDASFISVRTMIARARAFLREGGLIVALIKPQFEAGKERLGSGGVVRDAQTHHAVLTEIVAAIVALGLTPRALTLSPLRGPAGNVEFFVLIARGGASVGEAEITALTAQAHTP